MTGSKSWGHALSLLPPGAPQRRDWCADGRWCGQLATHLSVYNYVSGKAGHIRWAGRPLCDLHAAKFRAKHGLPEPEVGVAPRHALDRVLDGGDVA